MGLAPDHDHLAASLVVHVDDRPRLGCLPAAAADQTQRGPEALCGLALGLVVLRLGLLKCAPHPQQVVAKAVIRGQELRLLLGRSDELFKGVLEGRLDALLAV